MIFTDDGCVIGGTVFCGLPMLVDYDYKIIEAASDWLRHLRVLRRKSARSVRQFAYHLKYWWSFINGRTVRWDAVHDRLMFEWRDELLREGISERTVNGYISTVFRFYLWSERCGYTSGLIGEPDMERNIHPPLTVDVKFIRGGTKVYTSPVLISTTRQSVLPVPTNDEISLIHEALSELYGKNHELLIRDTLILTWMEQTGSRRAETLNLKVNQIPSWSEIDSLKMSGEKLEVPVLGKGGKTRSLWVGADLLTQTRDYIEEEREVVVAAFRRRLGTGYKRPKEIFLSSKTGRVLDPDSVSQSFAKAFRKAKVKGSGHRVRARFLTNLTVSNLAAELERRGSMPDLTSALLMVAEIAGHKNVGTLRPYIVAAKKRLLRQTSAERAAESEERAVAAERRADSNLSRLKATELVCGLVEPIRAGDKKAIIDELEKLMAHYRDN